jgi:hypothetical protein
MTFEMSTSQIPGSPPPQQPPQYPPQQQQPGLGPYGPPPPKRHRLRKWLLILTGVVAAFIGVVVALAFGLSSAANHAANPNSASAPPATAQPSSQPATSNPATPEPNTPAMLAQGDPASITTDGSPSATVTVTSVTTSTTPADQQFGSNPQNGHFVVANLAIAADPSFTQGFDINPLDFYVLNGTTQYTEGNGNSFDALSSARQELNATTLGAGQKTSGPIVFDVSSAHGYIVYAPNFNGQPLAEWKY